MKIVKSRWDHQDSVKIEWNLGKRCNMDCSYCPSEIHDNYSEHTDINVLKAAIDKLSTIERPLRISLTGGEPTVHPRIEEFIQHIRNSGVARLNVTTNGTRTVDWYKAQPVDQYVFSLHFEFSDWEKIVHKIVKLRETWNKDIYVHVMAHQDYMNNVRQAIDLFDEANIKYVVRRIRWTINESRDEFDDNRYTQDDLDWLLSKTAVSEPNVNVDGELYHANDVIKLHMNKFKSWSCRAGIESLMINWDGDVHRATCRVGGSLGNVYTGTFDIPQEPITCTRNFCTCAADIPITKTNERNIIQ